MKPRLLDLFCGAGGAARGYMDAGFYVVGVDHRPQPRYCGDHFIQEDALSVLRLLNAGYYRRLLPLAGIHASPPCQAYAGVTAWRGNRDNHPDLIAPTRELLGGFGEISQAGGDYPFVQCP